MNYSGKVYRKQGGDELVVEAGGKITVESGGAIDIDSGGLIEPQPAIADLDLTISDPPTDAEVQAISDKADEILAALRAAGVIAAS